ncbi:hypothetical protein RKD35_000632 [Streptomyces albogriseolus]
MSDDVPHDQGDAGAGQRDDVEPVAADARGGRGGQVPVGDLDGGLPMPHLGQQAVLEGQGGGAFPGETAGVVHAHGGPAGDLLGQDGVVLGELLGAEVAQGDRDAERGAAGEQRHGELRVDAGGPCRRRPEGLRLALGHPAVEAVLARPGEHGSALAQRPGGRRVGRVGVGAAEGDDRGGCVRSRGGVRHAAHHDVGVLPRRGRLRVEHPVEQVDRGEVGEFRHQQRHELLGGADGVQGGAEGGGGLVDQGQPAPGPVLLGAVQAGQRGADHPAGGVAQRPHLHVPRVLVRVVGGLAVALVAQSAAGLGDRAHGPVDGAGALAEARGVQQGTAEQGLLGAAHGLAGGGVEPDEAVLGVEHGDGQGRLLEGPAGRRRLPRAGGRGGDHVPGGLVPGPVEGAHRDPERQRVAVAVTHRDGSLGQGRTAGRGLPAARLPGEQVPHGTSHGLVGGEPGQPPGSLAPPRHDAAGIDGQRGGGVVHWSRIDPRPSPLNRGGGRLSPGGRAGRRAPCPRGRSCAAHCARPPARSGPGR